MRIFFILIIFFGTNAAFATKVYPFPQGEHQSQHFAVTINGRSSGVYTAHVKAISVLGNLTTKEEMVEGEAAFTSFEISGKARIVVTSPDLITAVKLLPSRWNIAPKIHGHRATFDLLHPGQYTIEINGDWNNSLHLFANLPEINVPRADDPNVIYFAAGVHTIEPLTVTSGKTVYLAPGAVVYGKEKACSVVLHLEGDNIIVHGRGIIDDSLTPRYPCGGETMVAHGTNLQIEGITLRDSAGWSLHVRASNDVSIDNVKIFGWRDNSDGIDINSSQNVRVSNGFIRTYDDLVVLKTTAKGGPPTANVNVRGMVLWNTLAHALSLGAEIRAPIHDVLFTDCDVIHDKGREWTLRVYNTDAALASHIVFDDIRVEETQRLTSVWIGKAIWSRDEERGHIDDIVFRNIRAPEGQRTGIQNEIVGFDANHMVHYVLYQDVIEGGHRLINSDIHTNQFAEAIDATP